MPWLEPFELVMLGIAAVVLIPLVVLATLWRP